jgi:hypothetical protein
MKEFHGRRPTIKDYVIRRFRKKNVNEELQAETKMQIISSMLTGIRFMEAGEGTEEYKRGGLLLDSAARAAQRNGWDAFAALDVAYHLHTRGKLLSDSQVNSR